MKKNILIACLILIISLGGEITKVQAQTQAEVETDANIKTEGESAGKEVSAALSLNQCLDLALKNNHEILAGRYSIQSAATKVGQALSFYFPQLGVEAGYNILDADRVSSLEIPSEYHQLFLASVVFLDLKRDIEAGKLPGFPPGTDPYSIILNHQETAIPYYLAAINKVPDAIESGYLGGHNIGAAISLTQPLFTGGKICGRYKQAVWNREVETHKMNAVAQKVLSEVCRTYFAVSHGQQLSSLAREMQGRFEMLLIITKAFMEDEKSTRNQFDYLTIRTYLKKIEHLLSQAKTRTNNGKLYLQYLLNVPQAVEVEGNTKTPGIEIQDYETSLKSMQDRNFNWQQLDLGKKIVAQEVEIAKAEFFPLIGVTGEYSVFHEEPQYGYVPESAWQVTFGAKWNFPLGLQTIEAVKEKQAESRAVDLQVQQAKKGLEAGLKSLLMEISGLKEQISILTAGAETAKKRAQLAIKGYRIDVVDSDDLVTAQVEESEMRLEYLKAILNYQIKLMDYYTLMGRDIHALSF